MRPSQPPTPKGSSGSRIPSPTRNPGPSYRSRRNSRTSRSSTPQRSRASSMSPLRTGAMSPYSTRSFDNISPVRLDSTDNSHSQELQDETGSGRNLVRYITENMIKRLAKKDQFEDIRTINFTLAGDKKIKYIEHLDVLKNLTTLNMSGNIIRRIEKLEHLTRLKSLNMAGNRITKIEGLETLVNLQVLNLENNQIEKVPLWLPKKLRALRTVCLAQNNINSLTDVVRLRGLHDLTVVTIYGNPLCDLPHHRPYILFHLRNVDKLDGQIVSMAERQEATQRFSQEELDRLSRELENTTNQLQQTVELHSRSMEENELLASREREMMEREARSVHSRDELERELDTKDELLKKKAKELQKAQAKQLALEQELAFIKLDAKFEPLNMPMLGSGDEDDSPYLGKSRYKRNEMAVERNLASGAQQARMVDVETRRQLDAQLAEKQRQLNEAAERLSALQRELRETQNQVIQATHELQKLEQATTERRLTEEEKQKLRQRLAAKMHKINQLKETVQQTEDGLAQQRAEAQRSKLEYDRLKAHLKTVDPNSPEYSQTKAEMASKEQQIRDLANQIRNNERVLDNLLKNIAVDTEAIKELEEQLERGTTSSDVGLRNELEDIVNGLQDYLLNVKQKADAQRAEFDKLLRDKEKLVRRLATLEKEKSMLAADVDDYGQLQQQLDALNKSMNDMQELNSALQNEAHHLSVHDADLARQLEAAEHRIEELSRSMQESDHKNKSDKATLSKQMEEMAKLQNTVSDREAESAALQKEIDSLKNEKGNLSDHLHRAMGSMLQPGEIAEQINALGKAVRRGDRKPPKPRGSNDQIDHALGSLHNVLMDVVDKENQDRVQSEKRLKALEKHMANLKKKLMEAQQEYRETMEAATDAKLEAEKKAHERALRNLDDDMTQLRNRLKEAEENAAAMRGLAQKEKAKREEEIRARDEKARFHDAKSQAALRDLERELGETRRGMRDRQSLTEKQLKDNQTKVEALHNKLQKLEDERADDMAAAADAEATAAKALRDLARADEEIKALQDLLHAHEREIEDGQNRGTMRRLQDTLGARQREVDRLRKALRFLKTDNQDEVDDLLNEIDALRNALSANTQHIRTLWPGYYYFVPEGSQSPGKWVYSHSRSRRGGGGPPPSPPPPPPGAYGPGIPLEQSGPGGLQPGMPGMVALREDGSLVLVPFEGLYCNVPEHHDLEDELAECQDALEKCREKRKAEKHDLEEIYHPLEESEARLHHLQELIKSHEETLEKLRKDEERMSKEKVETSKELADLKDTLTNKMNRKRQLEGRVEELLGEMRTEQALLQQEDMQEELLALEKTLAKRRAELREAERLLHESRDEAGHTEEKAEAMAKRYESARVGLSEAEQDAEELERQASETGAKLVRARGELRQLQGQIKEVEGRRIQIDDQSRQLARLVTNKEAEFTALEQKNEHLTLNLERLQAELIITEEKEAERLAALRESEKVLNERRDEINKLKEQASVQREELEGLDRLLGKKNTELHLLQENIEQHQSELSTVLKEGKADVQEKQKQIKQLRHDVDDLTSTKTDLETQITRRKAEISTIREKTEQSMEELQNNISEVNKQKAELKHVLEMLGLEQQELESLRRQHDVKSSELAETQRRLLEERTELDRMNSDAQRRDADLQRVKQNVEKYRADVDCLTTERSTLTDTVTSLLKEKEMLTSSVVSLDDRLQAGKKTLSDIRAGIDKSGATLDEVELELSHARKEVQESQQLKAVTNKELIALRAAAKEMKSEASSYKSELQDTQEQLQLIEQDLRASLKQRDDINLETTSLREEARARAQQLDLLNQQVKRKEEEAARAEEDYKDKRDLLEDREKELKRISEAAEREEERLSRTASDLNKEIQRLKNELCEQKDELEAIIIKRDATRRDMERLGHVEAKFDETESRIADLESRVCERERELAQLQRERSELKGALASRENELRTNRIEAENETRRLQQKVAEVKGEMERQRNRDSGEISSLEQTAQDHCERATRLANELNQMRGEYIQLRKELRFVEEEKSKQQAELQRVSRRLREEVDEKVSEGVNLLETSHAEAVKDLKDLYQESESNARKISTLREIQRSKSPPRRIRSYSPPPAPSPTKYSSSRPTPTSNNSMQTLQEELQAKQEEIASQIRRQMSRHREQWQARKIQSEGKLRSLKKKVDNLDELVSNTSMDSLSLSRGRDVSGHERVLISPTLEERENVIPERLG
uniref:Centriolin n=1 Tax=Phallusia mammillata TaxID=59560 RepID=A0A6F9D9J3_9ASCI|nr:centriolin [Phallusia mammillata]